MLMTISQRASFFIFSPLCFLIIGPWCYRVSPVIIGSNGPSKERRSECYILWLHRLKRSVWATSSCSRLPRCSPAEILNITTIEGQLLPRGWHGIFNPTLCCPLELWQQPTWCQIYTCSLWFAYFWSFVFQLWSWLSHTQTLAPRGLTPLLQSPCLQTPGRRETEEEAERWVTGILERR